MSVSDVLQVVIIVGYIAIAIAVPSMVLAVRRSPGAYALVWMLWLILAADVVSARERLMDDVWGIADLLRLAAIGAFGVFMVLYRPDRPDCEPRR